MGDGAASMPAARQQVTDFELVSVDRPDLGAFAGVGCAGEQRLPV